MERMSTGRSREQGMSVVVAILLLPVALVVAFMAVKAIGAYMDVAGFEGDVKRNISDMSWDCVAADCEPDLWDELDYLKDLKKRKLEIDYDNVDYESHENNLLVRGYRVIDFIFMKYTWRWELKIFVHR